MKLFLLKYILWLYETHIYEDWSEYTKLGKIVCYPAWIVRSALIWLTFPLWIPAFQFTQSKAYKHYQKFGETMSMEQRLEMIKQQKVNQKIEKNNFLIQKQSKGKYNKKF